jgi:tetratricopeptide (TPR) repeat protein
MITSPGTVKLLHDGILADQTGLSHGRAFFGPLSFGDYTLVVEVTGFKAIQKEVSLSVAMRYELDANLQPDSAENAGAAASAKPLLTPKAEEALDKALKALSANKLSDAEKRLNEAAKLAPGHPDVLYAQGVLFLKQQNWAQAETALEKASQMDPTNARAFSALGMALEDEGKHDQAIAPLEKSLQLDSGAWEPQWVLGEAYYHLQHYDEALKASQLAWTHSSGKAPQVELLLAKSLTAVGRYEDAAQSLRDFLKRYGNRPEAPTARRYLDKLTSDGKIHSN